MAAIPLGIVAVVFVLPYAAALSLGRAAVFDVSLLGALKFTVWQAALSTVFALALGLPGAWLVSAPRGQRNGKSQALLRALCSVPFAMPPILVVLGFVLFWGNSGWFNRFLRLVFGENFPPFQILYRKEAVILAHAFYNFPLVIRLVGDSLARIRRAYSGPAAVLGASPFFAALSIFAPLAAPAAVAAAFLVFLYCFTSFAVVLVLGGGPAAATLAVEIYHYANISLDYQRAGALAFTETLIAALVFGAYLFFEKKARLSNSVELAGHPAEHTKKSGIVLALSSAYIAIVILLVLFPLISIPLESFLFRNTRSALPLLGLRWWSSSGKTLLSCLARSLITAVVSGTAACVLAVLAASAAHGSMEMAQRKGKRSRLSPFIRMWTVSPLASSGIVLGLGWLILYGRERSGSFFALTAVHAVIALPFAFNSIYQGIGSLPRTTLQAASVFGAAPLARLRTVEIPMCAPQIRSAWAFSAAISLGELNAVLMLNMKNWETLPLYIYRAAAAYRYGNACAAGTLLLFCILGTMLLAEKAAAPPS
jgi:thiamine transport system permease protein